MRPLKGFLNEHRALFGHGPEALDSARTLRDYVDAHNGLRTIVWQQQVDGIAVFRAVFKAHQTRRGELVNVASGFVPDAVAAAEKGAPNRAARLARPPISAAQALAAAAQSVGATVAPDAVAVDQAAAGPERRQSLKHAGLSDVSAQYVWLPMDRTTLRLCWQVVFSSGAHGGMFEVLVDAETGEAIVREGRTEHISDASYHVYIGDSPSPFSPGHPTPSTGQPPEVPRVLITLPALDITASPLGWINDDVNETRGNNVDAHTDIDGNDFPDLPRPQGSPWRVFDFPLNLGLAPSTYRPAAVTQLFYSCNIIHDRYYQLGFTEAAGNFQIDNFGRGGLGNDPVLADAQDGGGTNNANFSTFADGVPGRMQMYVWTGPNPDRDGDLDTEIVIHEYSHGLSNRLVGGGVGLGALQSRGMGEGWSDFYALALLSEESDDVDGTYAMGGYATYLLSGSQQNYYFGIRRYPYSTDLNKNPLTFKDIDPTQASAHTGVPRNPAVGNSATSVHNIGEVWCGSLREARANLARRLGLDAANDLMLQLVTDGMKLSPVNPNFLQARDAIIQADLVLTGGANRDDLWAGFARRGLGASAFSPASGTSTGVREAFNLPGTPPYGLYLRDGSTYTNARGQQEKYFGGTSSLNGYYEPAGYWYYILPNGDLYEFTPPYANPVLTGVLVAQLGTAYYNNPGRLTYDLFQRDGSYFTDYRGQQEKYLGGSSSASGFNEPGGPWYFILTNGDLYEFALPYSNPELTGVFLARLATVYYDHPNLLPYKLYLRGGDYFANSRGEQEKYLGGTTSANGYVQPDGYWYYILPNGDLYEFTPPYSTPELTGVLVDQLGPAFYDDPSPLLTNTVQIPSVQ